MESIFAREQARSIHNHFDGMKDRTAFHLAKRVFGVISKSNMNRWLWRSSRSDLTVKLAVQLNDLCQLLVYGDLMITNSAILQTSTLLNVAFEVFISVKSEVVITIMEWTIFTARRNNYHVESLHCQES
jgi:hypothetical protein